jgi:tetratricopeptide (TPR) repeat protein
MFLTTVSFISILPEAIDALESLFADSISIRDVFEGTNLYALYSIFQEYRLKLAERFAWHERSLRHYDVAEWAHRQALDHTWRELGETHPVTLSSMNRLALVLSDRGKSSDAECLHRETLMLRKQVLGEEHPSTLASRNNLALALGRQKKCAEAERMHRDTLGRRVAVLGSEHLSTLISLHNLAQTLSRQGRYDDALPLYRQSCTGFLAILGLDDPITQACMDHYRYVQRQATGTAAEARLAER